MSKPTIETVTLGLGHIIRVPSAWQAFAFNGRLWVRNSYGRFVDAGPATKAGLAEFALEQAREASK